jgi:hypothetical protein
MMIYNKMEKFLEARIEEMNKWIKKQIYRTDGQLSLELGI